MAPVPILHRQRADQRQRFQQMFQQTIAAQNDVPNHHVAAHRAKLDWAHESQHQAGAMDDYMPTMDGLAGQYRGQ